MVHVNVSSSPVLVFWDAGNVFIAFDRKPRSAAELTVRFSVLDVKYDSVATLHFWHDDHSKTTHGCGFRHHGAGRHLWTRWRGWCLWRVRRRVWTFWNGWRQRWWLRIGAKLATLYFRKRGPRCSNLVFTNCVEVFTSVVIPGSRTSNVKVIDHDTTIQCLVMVLVIVPTVKPQHKT